ncbi:hypothetical protein LguiA_003967 [Lonicera macranthoides]
MEESWFYFISLSSLLILFLLVLPKLFQRRNKNLPPSPPSYPIIGHLHLLKVPIHRSLQNLSYKYGPIFTLKFGSRPVLIISSPQLLEECFTKNDIIFANRPRLLLGKHLGYNYTIIGFSQYGDHWRNLRRITTLEFLSTNRLNSYFSIRQEETALLLKNLFRNSSLTLTKGFSKVEMKSRLSELSFNVVMRMASGKRYFGAEVEDFEEAKQFRGIIRDVFDMSGASHPEDFLPFLRWLDFQDFQKRLVRLHKKSDAFLQSLVDDHRNKRKVSSGSDEKKTKTLIDAMLSLQDSEPEYYTDDIIKGNILTVLLAGTDTSSSTIEWAMSLLLNHPDVLGKARAELDNNISHDHLVDEADLSKFPYLQCIIHETLRLFPVAPLLVPHVSSDDCTIGGFDIPRGTMLLANAWAIHRDPKVWDDPTSFRPDRFESGQNEGYKFVPFGMGRRQCPGAGLANRVVSLSLAALIQCFEWERVSEELVDLSEGKGLTMPKDKPLEALCKAREQMINVLSELRAAVIALRLCRMENCTKDGLQLLHNGACPIWPPLVQSSTHYNARILIDELPQRWKAIFGAEVGDFKEAKRFRGINSGNFEMGGSSHPRDFLTFLQ